MIDFPALKDIVDSTPSKIVMIVVDGLGGAPSSKTGLSELETAKLPNLDRLAKESSGGLTIPVAPGVAPGSGPGHLSLFGYNPLKYFIGRGVLEALGIGVSMGDDDVAARGNFCLLDKEGLLVDRRAGRISSQESSPLVEVLDEIDIDGAELSIFPVKDYRFVFLMKGEGLSDKLTETDPQRIGVAPLEVEALDGNAENARNLTNAFLLEARERLMNQERANMVLLRGFSRVPRFPSFADAYKLNAAAIAAYPMYRGLANVVGMSVINCGVEFEDEIDSLAENYNDHDFFYVHYKPADAEGEDGNFGGKVKALEALDSMIPRILDLDPDVVVVAGDHATPSILAAHSWHYVPVLIRSKHTLGDGVGSFSERALAQGSLGTFQAEHLMLQVLSHAGKLSKYGP
ncbi:MAG: 2,3-bisphosphoglycerate-independent phosphoglycerate mutase [Chloroflexi bacterium]|jgi:2,3-bisphosphoglycerate-independent phosphoglycerate mutase|nr:MAG: 2,3-bisphosphoglycerate-independent phosphoglycerate mutase [Chloroflexota bacterium]